ncbi:MAG: biotin--[acetyl-CoA-carboxylase] ligase [Candidatus Eremiobacteraeota bacterium]|nr:biotin--[acetyl-CoA-carboxylase] ligase [Candidatus Eremiobacteraeota bacterium]
MQALDLASLRSQVSELPRFGRVEHFTSVRSTNAVAVERLYSNDSFGISFVTESQDEGRGRAGRAWFSPPQAGLLVSTILPSELPSRALPAVGFWAALAVREAVSKVTKSQLEMKWPNDLLSGGRKCGGILAQGRSRAQSSRVVIGLGLNVNRPADIPDQIKDTAAWLSDANGALIDRTKLLAGLLTAYECNYDSLLRDPAAIIGEWSALAALTGKYIMVKALDGSTLHEGIVHGIDHEGSLLVQTALGERTVRLGDVDVLN